MADTHALEAQLLFHTLPRVSRSFYFSLRVLPKALRRPIGLAYLLCRAADTIADTRLVLRERRLECLQQYRAAFTERDFAVSSSLRTDLADLQDNQAERELLLCMSDCFAFLATLDSNDQGNIRTLVLTLTQGMQMDLTVFPSGEEGQAGQIGAFETRHDLDQYTYFVAGCVGEFWTKVSLDHIPSLRHWDAEEMCTRAVRFGKGLQLTNILRDVAQDLRMGRCYLPHTDLSALGVEPTQLLHIAHYRAGATPPGGIIGFDAELLPGWLGLYPGYSETRMATAVGLCLAAPHRCLNLAFAPRFALSA